MPLEKMSDKFRGKSDDIYVVDSEEVSPETSDKIPVVPHKVLCSEIPFYSDPECTDRVPNAHIIILRPLDPDGYDILEVVPSRKTYTPGQYLTWHLNNKKMWESCFYRNPLTGQIEEAWSLHVEYAGRVLSDDTVAKNREKLNELEARYPQDSEIKVM